MFALDALYKNKTLSLSLSSITQFTVGLGDISFLHRYRDIAGCDMHIAEIAILAIIKKGMKPNHNSQTIQRTEMADPIFFSLSQNMDRGITTKSVTLQISDILIHMLEKRLKE